MCSEHLHEAEKASGWQIGGKHENYGSIGREYIVIVSNFIPKK